VRDSQRSAHQLSASNARHAMQNLRTAVSELKSSLQPTVTPHLDENHSPQVQPMPPQATPVKAADVVAKPVVDEKKPTQPTRDGRCGKCGIKYKADSKFCQNCGNKLWPDALSPTTSVPCTPIVPFASSSWGRLRGSPSETVSGSLKSSVPQQAALPLRSNSLGGSTTAGARVEIHERTSKLGNGIRQRLGLLGREERSTSPVGALQRESAKDSRGPVKEVVSHHHREPSQDSSKFSSELMQRLSLLEQEGRGTTPPVPPAGSQTEPSGKPYNELVQRLGFSGGQSRDTTPVGMQRDNSKDPSKLGSPRRPHWQTQVMTDLFQNRDMLKEHVVRSFKRVAGDKKELDLADLQQFKDTFSKAIRLPVELNVFDGMENECLRFDFTGSGSLDVKEVYKLSKFQLRQYMKQAGIALEAVTTIPVRSLGRMGYTLVKELGRGNQGVANLAKGADGEEYCIKCYPKDKLSDDGVLELKEDFEALKLLHCERVAGAFDMFQDNANYYMVGELFTGGDFVTLKQRAQAIAVDMTEDWWRDIFYQCFEGLCFMHEQAMMHCDIKEQNLMLKTSNLVQPEVVIIDVGVSPAMNEHEGNVSGTPGYVPPETLDTQKWFPVGDVFSMGVTIMQIMIDKVPNGSNNKGIFIEGCRNLDGIFNATRTRVPPFFLMPREFPQLRDLVERLLKKQMSERLRATKVLRHKWFGKAEPDASETPTRLGRLLEGLAPRKFVSEREGISKDMRLDVLEGLAERDQAEKGLQQTQYNGAR